MSAVDPWADRSSDLELAGRLVREAGVLAARMRAVGVNATSKTSISDVVTEADHAAEALVVSTLAVERPADGILGEEGSFSEGTSGRRWIIDPVDGTYNFVSGLDWWCSAVVLVEDDDVVLGAIYQASTDRLFVGGPGLGARLNGSALGDLPDGGLGGGCVSTYLHPPDWGSEVADAFGRVISRGATQRMLGSGSLDLTAVAQGVMRLYMQHSVPLWDRLPGQAIVTGLGGEAVQIEAAGRTWTLIGAPSAVKEAASALNQG